MKRACWRCNCKRKRKYERVERRLRRKISKAGDVKRWSGWEMWRIIIFVRLICFDVKFSIRDGKTRTRSAVLKENWEREHDKWHWENILFCETWHAILQGSPLGSHVSFIRTTWNISPWSTSTWSLDHLLYLRHLNHLDCGYLGQLDSDGGWQLVMAYCNTSYLVHPVNSRFSEVSWLSNVSFFSSSSTWTSPSSPSPWWSWSILMTDARVEWTAMDPVGQLHLVESGPTLEFRGEWFVDLFLRHL